MIVTILFLGKHNRLVHSANLKMLASKRKHTKEIYMRKVWRYQRGNQKP